MNTGIEGRDRDSKGVRALQHFPVKPCITRTEWSGLQTLWKFKNIIFHEI